MTYNVLIGTLNPTHSLTQLTNMRKNTSQEYAYSYPSAGTTLAKYG